MGIVFFSNTITMKMKRHLLIIIILTIITSCESNIRNKESKSPNDEYSLIIYDSIVFDTNLFYPKIVITDFDSSKALLSGFDWDSKDIILLNTKTKCINTFNKTGAGPGEYNEIRGLSFFNDSTIILLTNRDIIFYNLYGVPELIKSIKFANIFQGFNLFHFNIPHKIEKNGDTIVYIRHYNENLAERRFDKIKWLSKINLTKRNYRKVIKIPNESPLLSLDDKRYIRHTPSYSNIINDSLIYFMYPFDKTIYCYNINTSNLTNSISFYIPTFNPAKFSLSAGSSEIFKKRQTDDYCFDFFINSNGYFLVYSTGIPEKKIASSKAEYIESDIEAKYRNYFLVNINSEQKQSSDILLRDKNGNPLRILFLISNDRIYLLKNNIKKEENVFKIFIAKISKTN